MEQKKFDAKLEFLIKNNHYFIFKSLIKNSLFESSLFHQEINAYSCSNDRFDFVKLLFNNKHSFNYFNHVSFSCACSKGQLETVDFLLNNLNINHANFQCMALVLAVKKGHLNVAQLLLKDQRFKPYADKNSCIISAFENNDLPMIDFFWNNQKVKYTLRNDNKELYLLLIKKDNLSRKIKDF